MKKYIYNPSVLEAENDISYYILGAFMSDGNISIYKQKYYTSHIGSKDKDWIKDIGKILSPNSPIKQQDNFYTLRMYDNTIGKWFVSHNCIPAKSLCATMPNIPKKYLPDFIRGMFDGDGCITYTIKPGKTINFKSYICGSSIDLLTGIKQTLHAAGIDSILRIIKSKHRLINGKAVNTFNKHWRLEIGKLNTLKIFEYMYYSGHKISLKRKLKTFQTIKYIYSEDKKINNMLNTHLKIKWPSDDELIQLVSANTYMAVSRLLGVSNTAIICYMKNRNIFVPKGKGKGVKNISI